ncbi:Two component serine/threonine-protein kinase with PASTA sensors [Modestobacter italicus]|uniref:non-specific serine/threonine protein kinase n=1 Tax=Modestobacter italicus (strain DSM 44449 / CECT 9708 / BC 501) TaxID=2732864 RepID=I4EQ33_MODI5|nr:serine/threonine-protein kinase [Modestobacter marinus]CCH85496.1 Two component serine/threonine-protein kinase with PASTA sensors [Modestobacter marinus]
MAVRVGSLLAGRYEITAPIATGGMGEVWKARDRTLGRTIAVKVLRSEYTGDSSFLIRFRNEARHTAALSHPNIASVYDYGETTEDGQRLAYLVMEFVEGKPLVTILAERGRLTAEQTLDVLGQAGDGLSAAHAAGMVHRDIKPGNLLVRPDGVVKLTDFGIAYARDAAPLTRTGMVVGTAQYLSPEQAQGHVVTAASDVYSLGVLGYECVAGVRPFDGESQVAIALAQINRPPPPMPADVPRPVKALIERALTKDPAGRFPDGGAFALAVRQVAAGGTVPPPTAMTTVLGGDDTATAMIPAGALTSGGAPSTAPRTMPPLHGTPVDDDRAWDDEDVDDPARRRRTRLIWAAAALTLLLLVGVGVAVALSGGGSGNGGGSAAATGTSATSRPAASTNASGGIDFDVASYVGEDADDVQEELEGLGLEVRQADATEEQLQAVTQDLDEGTVATADPAQGPFEPGSLVTLYVTGEAYTPEEAEVTETTAPAPTSGAPTSAAPTATGNGGGGASGSRSSASVSSTRSTASSSVVVPPPTTTAATSPPATTSAPAPTTTAPSTQPTEATTDVPAVEDETAQIDLVDTE